VESETACGYCDAVPQLAEQADRSQLRNYKVFYLQDLRETSGDARQIRNNAHFPAEEASDGARKTVCIGNYRTSAWELVYERLAGGRCG
jgi:hypothetical protein